VKFGEAIKKRREQLGLTQQDLAEKLFVSRQTVCRWENGSRYPDLVMAKKSL
jgi:transcriptional regulator with XRE-family HTH domain